MGQILGVISNPAETLRQLNESREMLRKAKEDLELSNEAKKIPPKHTFSRLPGFHGRKAEQALLRRVLSNTPKMTVVFGATSVGKTALLREVLATDDFFVIKFDLRISGFADLRTLYLSLCAQFESFFQEMNDEEMNKNMLTFKHLKLEFLEKEKPDNGVPGYQITVADLASLMESLQSCLLKYWDYNAETEQTETGEAKQDDGEAGQTGAEIKARQVDATQSTDKSSGETKITNADGRHQEAEQRPFKKRPIVFLMDEAHKLPALVDDQLSLKVFLDTLLVITKQDRLCHVVLSTSDSFFHHFLRSMNVGHHAQIMTIGDVPREEAQTFYHEHILPSLPDGMQSKLTFDELYDAFGGKLAHLNDYVSSWSNNRGDMTVYESAIFVQAYTLLQFHLTRANFETYSPLSTATSGKDSDKDDAKFSPTDLVYVMKKMTSTPYSIPYFQLCREVGTDAVDSMIKTRILELRWTKSVTPEDTAAERLWSEDGIQRPVVLPMTRIIRRAMEIVLKELDEHEIERNAEKAERKAEKERRKAEEKDRKRDKD
ncbi:uncharacterized protein MYCFIDRAFT_195430 [Pseudocercospora fijiensis CIRAD86]|uniref:ATPase domain-containing protein n=1 Tax=Pseudocercospora fijiensis (strain CIRAD86) TaxID=383855 RepID=M3B4R3_PSEFD|nr:uncharacterized protein MYCFIDRAFT_195430 [Pseudocercospora fijiensis CIRAD86]EME84363.1 hypothetical protein MYCFIDRAFT_195430 [Pseudocercospora fijiensis CIRAD86]